MISVIFRYSDTSTLDYLTPQTGSGEGVGKLKRSRSHVVTVVTSTRFPPLLTTVLAVLVNVDHNAHTSEIVGRILDADSGTHNQVAHVLKTHHSLETRNSFVRTLRVYSLRSPSLKTPESPQLSHRLRSSSLSGVASELKVYYHGHPLNVVLSNISQTQRARRISIWSAMVGFRQYKVCPVVVGFPSPLLPSHHHLPSSRPTSSQLLRGDQPMYMPSHA
ncbi:hypothetical protein BDY19DRAFT_609084 [Irpex rosettiformis]|uniref:Uncharacterized protein n=1 Tax=Irpex rosettiformis TaxID=378272 RepID=A0ACB8TPE5_9APHY|nr:hypothetical protein BDY19DRAFT_609084 [Irpex rosettiformis]